MRLLFVHKAFPGQFKTLAPTLATLPGFEIAGLHERADLADSVSGMTLARYRTTRKSSTRIHPWLNNLESQTILGEAAYRRALDMKRGGFVPDAIVGHPGWGEMLFLKDVWPAAKMGVYCEYYYSATGTNFDFDPEFADPQGQEPGLVRMMNAATELTFRQCDAGLCPTLFQAETFPAPIRERLTIIHDGVDTATIRPRGDVEVTVGNTLRLTRQDEVVTFVSRQLEPYRGFHIFMRALPRLLRDRPQARVLIIGDEGPGYGPPPPRGTWKQRFVDEIRPQIAPGDWERVHFMGRVPYAGFVALLQLSSVHVYLSYPFVLSWSLSEAMSAGCSIVACDTAPVREAIRDGETGMLVPFFEPERLAGAVTALLADAPRRSRLGTAARAHAVAQYDPVKVVNRQLAWIRSFAG